MHKDRSAETVTARIGSGRFCRKERVIRCARVDRTPRCLCNFGGKRNDAKDGSFHERSKTRLLQSRTGEIQAANSEKR
ncbi:MAG: hypothetical protein DMF37_12600 [Verrucomicrobia bacterium]|nr:MAG: hypothetical protein DMF37_12600 [Verrucomicrobiota bacterium]